MGCDALDACRLHRSKDNAITTSQSFGSLFWKHSHVVRHLHQRNAVDDSALFDSSFHGLLHVRVFWKPLVQPIDPIVGVNVNQELSQISLRRSGSETLTGLPSLTEPLVNSMNF